MADYSYIGSGKLSLREIGASLGFIEVGNCSALNFAVTEDVKELKDFTQPGGGTYNEVRRISAVEMSFTAHDVSPANLARATLGGSTAVASSSVSGEAVTVYPGQYSPFANMHAATPAPTLVPAQASAAARVNTTAYALGVYITPATPNGFYYKATAAGTSGGSPPTYPTTIGGTVTDGTVTWTCAGKTTLVADTDYTLGTAGVYPAAAATIAGEVWTAGYTRTAHDVVQALVNSSKEYELLFEGLNEARSGKRTRVRAWRVKAGALANLALIGEEYAAMEQTGKLLKDTTKTGAGVSQYFKAEIEA
jgi:hypothetical protein